MLETHLGHPVTDFSLAMANALAQALGQGPAGLLVDIGNRLLQISEIQARQAVWAEREAELAQHRHGPVTPLVPVPRPVPLPAGPIERYTDQASLASLGAFGVTWALTGSPRAGTTALMAGLPKAARMGREAFASQAGRVLADRGVVVLDPGVLRRLDRIDTVVVEVDVVTTGCWCLGEAVGMGPLGGPEVLRQAQALFDPDEPERCRRRGPWTLGLLDDLGIALPKGARTRARALAETRTPVLGLARDDVLVGLVSVVAEMDPLAEALARAVLADNHLMVIGGTRGGVARRLGAGRSVAGGHRMDDAVRTLQAEGRAVALVGRNSAALRAADCGIGLLADNQAPPWGADVLCGPGLAAACLIVEAFAPSRRTSRASASLALTGSAVGATWAFVGSPVGAGKRALLPVNGAAMLALGAGAWTGAALARRPTPVAAASVAWHELEPADVLARLGSSDAGLETSEARRRLAAAEAASPAGGPPSLGQAVVAELATPLTPVLAVGAALSAAVGSLTDAWLVGGVVGANALVSATERLRTERALQRLMTSAAIRVRVRRDDTPGELASSEVVIGDVLSLRAGEVVPADCRILDAASLEVDESALTGESLPVSKGPGICAGAAVAERSCMLYEGTTVVAGTASAVVVAVAPDTEAARAIDAGGDAPATGVEARLAHLTTTTVPLSVLSGAAVAGLSLVRGRPPRRPSAQASDSWWPPCPRAYHSWRAWRSSPPPAAWPPATPWFATRRVSRPWAGLTCCASTRPAPSPKERFRLQRVSDGRRDQAVDVLGSRMSAVLRVALRATPIAHDGATVPHATDEAVLEGAAAAGVGVASPTEPWTAVTELPFETGRGFHAVVGRVAEGNVLAVKGAPEVVLRRCRQWTTGGHSTELDGSVRRELDRQVERLAGKGLRVLAVAERRAGNDPAPDGSGLEDDAVDDLDFVGFVALADAVRPTAKAAIADLGRAGVDVAMITGDHPATARAIASDLGILNGHRVLTGAELDSLDDAALAQALPDVSVFARVTPAHKVRIVEGFQRAGRIVAMTGDGANDAPAIRLAHAGIALGQRGAAPAREAADLVVTDDRIETLIEAIVEGRAMWVSVRDALAILLGGNLGEVVFSLAGTAVTGRSPLNARQLLVVNMLTDLLPAMAIAMRPPQGLTPEALLHEGPEASLGAALARDIAWRGATTAAGAGGAWAIARATGSAARASTVGLVELVGTQLGQTMVSGGTSPLAVVSSLAAGATLAAIVQVPGLSQFFGCTPLDPLAWATALGAASVATAVSVAAPATIRFIASRSSGATSRSEPDA